MSGTRRNPEWRPEWAFRVTTRRCAAMLVRATLCLLLGMVAFGGRAALGRAPTQTADRAPVRTPVEEQIAPFLATPAEECLYEMPVVIISYVPTRNGVDVDTEIADYVGTVDQLRAEIERFSIQTKFILEEGSRFRGYRDAAAPPSLGYRVVRHITVFEEMPEGKPTGTPGVYFPAYDQILTRVGAEELVEDLGVQEFWVWGYHHGNIVPVESNMASPTTGDISNSFRFEDDMPVFDRTYVLYNYNFTRSAAEAVHNHGHQLEAMFSYVNQRQDGNTDLFWQKFVGRDPDGAWRKGRCGDTHHPPNAESDYDYSNTTVVESDIADWLPDGGGPTMPVNLSTWRDVAYAWPDGVPAAQDDAYWYIYWMQSMPGRGNGLPYGEAFLTNWWRFVGDWDGSITSGLGLYARAAPVVASASIDRKGRLVVTGANFESGATILVDGVAKRTKAVRTDPDHMLRSKKAGKVIAEGQTVALAVRNPDGAVSAEFAFTRP